MSEVPKTTGGGSRSVIAITVGLMSKQSNIRELIDSIALKDIVKDDENQTGPITAWENANTCGYFATASSQPLICGSPSVCATNTDNIVACTMDGGLSFFGECLNGQDYKAGKCDNLNEFDMILCCGDGGAKAATECGTFVWTQSPVRTMFSCVKTAGMVFMLDEPLAVMQTATTGSDHSGSGGGPTFEVTVTHAPTTTPKQATLTVSTSKASYSFELSSKASTKSLTSSGGIGGPITVAPSNDGTSTITKSVTVTSIIVSTGTITVTDSVFVTGTKGLFPSSTLVVGNLPTSSTTAAMESSSGLSDGAKAGVGVGVTVGLLILLVGVAMFIFKKRGSFYQHAGVRLEQMAPQNGSNESGGTDHAAPMATGTPVTDLNQNDGQAQNIIKSRSRDNTSNGEDVDIAGGPSDTVHHSTGVNNNDNIIAELEGSPVIVDHEAPAARASWTTQRGSLMSLFKTR